MEIGAAVLGEPVVASRTECRWGRRGSFSLRCSGSKRGLCFDHERGEGGDLIDLIARERDVGFRDALVIAHGMLGGCPTPASREPLSPLAEQSDAAARTAYALQLWRQAKPIAGTRGQRYFEVHRGLSIRGLPLDHAVRWHDDISAVVAGMTNRGSGHLVGIHRTFLNRDGTKRARKMLARQGVVRLSPDDAITTGLGVTEGIEDGLAVLLSGWSPIWAATSAGAIARLPVVLGIESITVFADADGAGLRAAQVCCERWRGAGREARFVSPRRTP